MAEVPQEDFDLDAFKNLKDEIRNTVQKPHPFYYHQAKLNPKHARKMTQIEDFVQVLPTSAESYIREEVPSSVNNTIDSIAAIEPDVLNSDILAIEYPDLKDSTDLPAIRDKKPSVVTQIP